MQNAIARQVARDRTLDYLFQESVEEQFAALRASQDKPAQRPGLVTMITRWFQGNQPQADPYEDYLESGLGQ